MNFLDTNTIFNNKENNNIILPLQLKKILLSSKKMNNIFINNTTQNIQYIGKGINGDLFKIPKKNYKLNDSKYYVIKVFKYNKKDLNQIKKELKLLHTLENIEYTKNIINPCIDTIITKLYIITIFNSLNGITILDFIKECHNPKLNENARDTLLKYVLKQLLDTIYKLHNINLCHLQLKPNNILIKLNTTIFNNLNSSNNVLVMNNIENKDTLTEKEKLIPMNSNIYRLGNNNIEPLEIILTNISLGCGKIIQLPNHNKKFICNINNLEILDPYITTITNFDIELGKKYDIFQCGLICLMCILNYKFIEEEILVPSFRTILLDKNKFSLFIDKCKYQLINNDFILYYNYIYKYCLGPLKDRTTTKHLQDYIIINEKHLI